MDLAAAGHDVIGLAVGEPDFATPARISNAAIRAIEGERLAPTADAGLVALREAIAGKLARDNGLAYSADEIIVSSGGHQVLYNAFAATLEPGDEVVLPAPYWATYPDAARLGGATPVVVRTDEADGFKLRAESLASALTHRTRWFVLNTPGNPTGAVYGADELAALADVLACHPRVWILSDEVYEDLIYPGATHRSIAALAPALKERTLTLSALSKSYAMTGWRIGYGAGPRPVIEAMTRVQAASSGGPPTVSQRAAIAALAGPRDELSGWRLSFRRRRDLTVDALRETPGLRCARPDGAFFVYPNCSGVMGRRMPAGTLIRDSEDLARYLLDAAGVAVVPGTAFGMDPYVRISFATDDALLEQACRRLSEALAELTGLTEG